MKQIKRLFLIFRGDYILRTYNRVPRILFWHGVDKRISPNVETEILDIGVFEKQIKYLKKNYEIISIENFENRLRNNTFTNHEIVLTFDDGYANNLYVVEPILSKYNLPFTVFVSTEHITTGHFFPTSVNRIITKGAGLKKIKIPSQNLNFSLTNKNEIEKSNVKISILLKTLPVQQVEAITNDLIRNVSNEQWLELKDKYKSVRPMNWDEVIELSKKENVTIGSHCMLHICCHENQNPGEVKKQITNSKIIIENKLQTECKYFAYPNGDYTNYSNKLVSKTYSLGFSAKGRDKISNKNNFSIIPRIGVPSNLDTFKIIINLYPK